MRQEMGDAALLQADPETIEWLSEKSHLISRIGLHIDVIEAASVEAHEAVRGTLTTHFSIPKDVVNIICKLEGSDILCDQQNLRQ